MRRGMAAVLGLLLAVSGLAQEGGYIAGGSAAASGGGGDVTAGAVIGDNRVVRGDGGAKGVQSSGVTLDDSNNITGIVDLTASDQVIADDLQGDTLTNEAGTGRPSATYGIAIPDEGQLYFDADAFIDFEETTNGLLFGGSTSDYLQPTASGSKLQVEEVVLNGQVYPTTDGGGNLGTSIRRWDGFYLYPDSAPRTVATTPVGAYWLTAAAGPYGATDGCEQGGCISTSFLFFDGSKWGRVDGELTNLASSAASVTLPIGRALLADTSANPMSVSIVGCTAALDGQRYRVKLYTWDASNDIVTITPASGTIDKAASKTITNLGDSLDLACYGAGTDWYIH